MNSTSRAEHPSQLITRRRFIRSCLACSVALSIPLVYTNCTGRKTLRIANWADLIGENTLADFEKEYGCAIIYENYSSNEELRAKLSLHPGSYDIVVPSDYMVEQLAKQDLLASIDHSLLSNLDNLDKRFLDHDYDPMNSHSIPYVYWGTGIAVNKDRFSIENGDKIKWDDLFTHEAAGRVTLLDEMRYTIGMALLMNGFSVNTTSEEEIDIAVETLISIKPNLMAFVTDVKDLLIRGETTLSYAYSGDVYQAAFANHSIEYHIPKGGGIVGIDNMCITSKAKEIDLAYKFIDYILRHEVAASITNYTYYATANRAAVESQLVNAQLLHDSAVYIPIQSTPQLHVLRDLGSKNELFVNAWDRIKRA